MKPSPDLLSIRDAFSETLAELAADNQNLYVVSADLKSSLALSKFAAKFRSRFIECGVAESNAAGVAAGLAKSGKKVFLATYACFSPAINWAVIKQSICYNKLDVKIIGSHGGLMTGDLGATHQMLEDIALMRVMPNMEVFCPIDAIEVKNIIKTTFHSNSPSYIRLVRPSSPVVSDPSSSFTIGKSEILKKGDRVSILGYGPILINALHIKTAGIEVINCSSIKPLDSQTILKSIKKTGRLVVIEDHQQVGGLGEAVSALLLKNNIKTKFIHLAVDNQFGRSGKDYQKLFDVYHIGQTSLNEAVKKII